MEKGVVPPNLYFEKVNPAIHLKEWKITIPTEVTPWPQQGLRRISINSFGYGGTNAHAILDDAANYLSSRALVGRHNTLHDNQIVPISNGNGISNGLHHDTPLEPKLFFLSSNEQSGITRSSKALLQYLSENKPTFRDEPAFLDRLALTLGEKRSRLPWKTCVVASTVDELEGVLSKPQNAPLRTTQPASLAFIFTGQGAQWPAMGLELLSYPIFRQSLEDASAHLQELGCTWNLIAELSQDSKTSKINEPSRSQPICTAVQVGLVDLLADWNIKPKIVIGHSSGEIGAAYAKGSITKRDAWSVSYHRGRLASNLTSKGAMAAVGLGEAAIQPYLKRVTDGRIVVGCINSPSGVTLSGDASGIDQVVAMLEEDKVFARKLLVKNAYHSSHMEEIAADYLKSIKNVSKPISGNDVLMFSSVTGALVEGTALDAKYWESNMVNPVKFSQAVQAAMAYSPGKRRTARNKAPFNVFLEVGPHSALQGPLKQILSAQEGQKVQISYLSVLSRGVDAIRSSLDTVGKLIQQDLQPSMNSVNRIGKSVFPFTNLPPFAWNRELTYWYESAAGKAYRNRALPRHDLVGALSEYSTVEEPSWRNYLRVEEMPWMEHHKVQGSILYPLAGMIVMVIEASKQVADKTREIEGYELRDVAVLQAMIVPVDDPVETKLQFR